MRSVLNASLCRDLINEVKTKQESRLYFDVSYSDGIKYAKEDFQLGIKSLIDSIGMKTKYVEVCLHIPGVVAIPGSLLY